MSKKPAPKKEEPAPAPVEEKKEEVKPQKAEKPRREKKHRKEKGVHALYKVEGDKVARLRPTCERCGTGYFMAEHKDRFTCGHCGFTRYKQAK
jgi:small subunit ribosomal protein S27Ae